MTHQAARTGYERLTKRLNKFPQGAPPTKLLFEILKVLMSEKEASLVALVPIKPFTAATAARAWKTSLPEAQKTLDALASHRAMAAVLGVILKLPPVKQAMASKQMKSRYLETLISRLKL